MILDGRFFLALVISFIMGKLIRVIQQLSEASPEIDHEQYQAELEASIAELDRIIES
jgi:hypothetical protein